MEKVSYAIKNKNGRYYTSNDGWTLNIDNAELMTTADMEHYFSSWPKFFNKSKPIRIRETYSREEVK